MVRKSLKFAAEMVCLVILLMAAGATWLWFAAAEAPRPLERRGNLQAVEQTASYLVHGDRVQELRLESDTGLTVDIAVRTPSDVLGHRPLLLLMGGQETGRAAVEVIPSTRGAIVAAISYPFGTVPHRSLVDLFLALPRIQRGIFDTPAAALLALEYLLGPESGISPQRVELAGISFGAYLAPVPAALDPRVQRLWLIHGGGAAADVLDFGLRKRVAPAPLRRAVANYLATVAGAPHLGPEAWVYKLSPRPLVLVHATEESALPPGAVRALESAAREPVEVLWTPGKHVHPKRAAVVDAITELMFSRISCTGMVRC